MKRAVDMGLTEKVKILAGITPMKSLGMARYMKNFVPGMDVPESVVNQLKAARKEEQSRVGMEMAAGQVREMKEIPGVAGVHLMLIEWEEHVPEFVEMAGLLPRPVV